MPPFCDSKRKAFDCVNEGRRKRACGHPRCTEQQMLLAWIVSTTRRLCRPFLAAGVLHPTLHLQTEDECDACTTEESWCSGEADGMNLKAQHDLWFLRLLGTVFGFGKRESFAYVKEGHAQMVAIDASLLKSPLCITSVLIKMETAAVIRPCIQSKKDGNFYALFKGFVKHANAHWNVTSRDMVDMVQAVRGKCEISREDLFEHAERVCRALGLHAAGIVAVCDLLDHYSKPLATCSKERPCDFTRRHLCGRCFREIPEEQVLNVYR